MERTVPACLLALAGPLVLACHASEAGQIALPPAETGGTNVAQQAPAAAAPAPASQASASQAPAQAAPERLALLVGIDRYPKESGLQPLKGCARDVEHVRKLLTERFGFRDQDVVVLRDEQATHEAIVRTFQRALIERARPGTEAVFYFAGHGSRVPDADDGDAREADGLDSTYLAYDSRGPGRDGEHDLTDDELRSLVAAVGAKGAFTTVLTDSCHSGAGLRGGGFRARSAAPGRRPLDRRWANGFWPAGVPLIDDSIPAPVVLGSSIHIAACRRDQVAGEIPVEIEPGRFVDVGAMTWHLGQTLYNVPAGVTWSTVADQTSILVTTALPYQNLAYSGAAGRVVFGSAYETVPGWRARALDQDIVLIDAGWMHGVRRASELEVSAASDTSQVYGVVYVEWLSAVQARSRWKQRPAVDLANVALRAVEISRPIGEPPLSVWCDVPGLAPWFGGCPWMSLTSSIEGADYVVRAGMHGYQMWTAEGLPLPGYFPILPPTGADQAAWLGVCDPWLRREALWQSTSRLALETGGLALDVGFAAATLNDCRAGVPAGWGSWVPATVHDSNVVVGGLRQRGELPMGVFKVKNTSSKPVRLTVLNLPEDERDRRPIDPQPGHDQRVLDPGQTHDVRVGFAASDTWPLTRPMRDRYLFLATLAPFDVTSLVSDVALRGDEAPLPGLLREAQARSYTKRGAASATDLDRSGFGVKAVDVLVERPR